MNSTNCAFCGTPRRPSGMPRCGCAGPAGPDPYDLELFDDGAPTPAQGLRGEPLGPIASHRRTNAGKHRRSSGKGLIGSAAAVGVTALVGGLMATGLLGGGGGGGADTAHGSGPATALKTDDTTTSQPPSSPAADTDRDAAADRSTPSRAPVPAAGTQAAVRPAPRVYDTERPSRHHHGSGRHTPHSPSATSPSGSASPSGSPSSSASPSTSPSGSATPTGHRPPGHGRW